MATYEVLLPEVLTMVPGCPDTLAENTIRSAAIEFCERSLAYRVDLDPVTTVKNLFEYDLEPPTGTTVHEIISIVHNGSQLAAGTPKLLDLRMPTWRKDAGEPKYYVKVSPSLFWLAPVPAETKALSTTIRVALKPTYTSDAIDDEVLNDYHSAIVNGALYRLLRMPSREWTDLTGAQVYGSLFEQEVAAAKKRADFGNAPVVRKVKYGGITSGNRRDRYGRGG